MQGTTIQNTYSSLFTMEKCIIIVSNKLQPYMSRHKRFLIYFLFIFISNQKEYSL